MKIIDRFYGKRDGESESDARFGVSPITGVPKIEHRQFSAFSCTKNRVWNWTTAIFFFEKNSVVQICAHPCSKIILNYDRKDTKKYSDLSVFEDSGHNAYIDKYPEYFCQYASHRESHHHRCIPGYVPPERIEDIDYDPEDPVSQEQFDVDFDDADLGIWKPFYLFSPKFPSPKFCQRKCNYRLFRLIGNNGQNRLIGNSGDIQFRLRVIGNKVLPKLVYFLRKLLKNSVFFTPKIGDKMPVSWVIFYVSFLPVIFYIFDPQNWFILQVHRMSAKIRNNRQKIISENCG